MSEPLASEIVLGIKMGESGSACNPLADDAQHTAAVGSWVRLPYPDLRGQPIAQVREVRVADLYLPELNERGELQPEKRRYVDGYVARLKAGEQAPNVQIVEMEDGRLRVVDGHRRAVSALRAARETIRATVSPLIDTPDGKVPLTMELAREMATLRDMEEPVLVGADPGPTVDGITHLRFYLNEEGMARITEVQRRVEADQSMGEDDFLTIPFLQLGARLEYGSRFHDDVQWNGWVPAQDVEMAVYFDGVIPVVKKTPVTGQTLRGDFLWIGDLREAMERYDERLRAYRAGALGSTLEAAMPHEDGEPSRAPSFGPGPI